MIKAFIYLITVLIKKKIINPEIVFKEKVEMN